jgi:outer membrane protein OmpA-like peptidoglycan-associated protein
MFHWSKSATARSVAGALSIETLEVDIMKRMAFVLMLSLTFFWGCKKKEAAAPSPPQQQTATTAPGGGAASGVTPATVPPSSGVEPSLVSFSAGALIVQKPQEYGGGWEAINLLDENPSTGWAAPKGVTSNQVTVIELPERTLLKRLEFDTAQVEEDARAAKDVDVEVSDSGPSSGFLKIAGVSLEARADRQQFPVSAEVPGRWVRLTAKNNHGSPDYTEIMDFRGYGVQLTHTPFPDVSGTYDTSYNKMHLLQQGTSVTGCYEYNGGLLTGGLEGRIMKVTWTEDEGRKRGPAVMVFSADGRNLLGLWWYEGSEKAQAGHWDGPKVSTTVGSCPHWKGVGTEQQIAEDLEKLGRSRVYGINFDTDSDRIKEESKPTLDKIVALLKAEPGWKLTIEGHTDSTASMEYNQRLSERRAAAVSSYLAAAGIDGSRLSSVGYGATRPVAANDTPLGRAQNRRVELTKN